MTYQITTDIIKLLNYENLSTILCNTSWELSEFRRANIKKIRKKAKESVERTLERKTEEKVANTTEKAIDSVFEAPKRNSKKPHEKRNCIQWNLDTQYYCRN